jgi:ribonuclease HI
MSNEIKLEKCVSIYTDGSCSQNPGPGGWAFLIRDDTGIIFQKSGGEIYTTNNRMELTAAVKALTALLRLNPRPEEALVFTDSQYVKQGITEWIQNWKYNGWRTSDKTPVKNRDLWERLDKLAKKSSITWEWVKGHKGNEYNELCDAMARSATAAMKTAYPAPTS